MLESYSMSVTMQNLVGREQVKQAYVQMEGDVRRSRRCKEIRKKLMKPLHISTERNLLKTLSQSA